MKKMAVLTSGGDAPGMNACVRAAVRTALARDGEMVGVRRGYAGLLERDFTVLDRRAVANIIHHGGTILGTSRSEEFKTVEGRKKAAEVLRRENIEGLIVIGGDGSFRGGTLLAVEGGLKVVGIPGTIDNDVYGTDSTIGFDTAVNCALDAIDRVRDTALSHDRVFFVEVMGRHTGYIAMESGIAGGVEELLTPESPMTVETLCSHLEHAFNRGKRSAIVVVAEKEEPGVTFEIAEEVHRVLGLETRVCILGHIQRGGSPTARDRVLASKLGAAAVKALWEGKEGYMVGEMKGKVVHVPLKDTWEKFKGMDPELEELASLLCQ